jgi:antitoxin VapB
VRLNERLIRLKRHDLAARLLAIGHKTASRMSAETRRADHDELLYDERGLPA